MKDLKFTASQLVYCIHLLKQVFEDLVTYSKVKRINRGYVTHYCTVLATVQSSFCFFGSVNNTDNTILIILIR